MPVHRNKILVIGGDLRLIKMAEGLVSGGFEVIKYATSEGEKNGIEAVKSLEEGVGRSDIVILGLPVSHDGVTVCAPFYKGVLYIDNLIEKLGNTKLVLGGKISEELAQKLDERGIEYADYLKREEMAVANAVPTAEGAIEIAMSEMPITICGSNCLVVGYGRIGKCLAKMLHGIGANVTVAARSEGDMAMVRALGFDAAKTSEMSDCVNSYDLIINTVPHKVINEAVIEKINRNTLLIDLASKPGGVDFILCLQHDAAPISRTKSVRTQRHAL